MTNSNVSIVVDDKEKLSAEEKHFSAMTIS